MFDNYFVFPFLFFLQEKGGGVESIISTNRALSHPLWRDDRNFNNKRLNTHRYQIHTNNLFRLSVEVQIHLEGQSRRETQLHPLS